MCMSALVCFMFVCAQLHVHLCVCVRSYMCTCVCLSVLTCAPMCAPVCVCVHLCVSECACWASWQQLLTAYITLSVYVYVCEWCACVMCTCVHLCKCTFVWLHLLLTVASQLLFLCVFCVLCVCVCLCVCVWVSACVCLCVCVWVSACVCACVFVFECVPACVPVCYSAFVAHCGISPWQLSGPYTWSGHWLCMSALLDKWWVPHLGLSVITIGGVLRYPIPKWHLPHLK
jgi:hypothetical protein